MGAVEILMNYVAPSVGVTLANIMFSSPLMVVLETRKTGVVGDLNPIPYPVIFANCLNWILYSFVERLYFLFWGNLPGMLLGIYFIMSMMPLVDVKMRLRLEALTIVLLGFELLVCGFVAFICVQDKDVRQMTIGLSANFILLIYYAAPLSTVWTVLSTRTSSSLYWPMCLANCINGFAWSVYGLYLNDYFLAVPNGLGFVFGLSQLLLVMIFPSKNKNYQGTNNVDLENMGKCDVVDTAPVSRNVDDTAKDLQIEKKT